MNSHHKIMICTAESKRTPSFPSVPACYCTKSQKVFLHEAHITIIYLKNNDKINQAFSMGTNEIASTGA